VTEKRGLGKGLGALLSGTLADDDAAMVREVRLDQIRPNPYQPRSGFDPVKMAELTESVREFGVLQPVLLRRVAIDAYELIAGERRLRAAQDAGLTTIPAIVKEYANRQMLEVALIENVQREDINPVDAARAFQRLNDEFHLSQAEIARRVGKDQSTISKTIALLDLPDAILESLRRGEITEGHARTLLSVGKSEQLEIWENIRRRNLSVRLTERFARRLRGRAARADRTPSMFEETPPKDPNHAAVEEALQIALGTKVSIHKKGGVGKLEIEFYSEEELEGIVERIIGPHPPAPSP
jgi:ParB family chromosome partitioning protein